MVDFLGSKQSPHTATLHCVDVFQKFLNLKWFPLPLYSPHHLTGYLCHVISYFIDMVDFILMSFNMFPLPSVLPMNGQLDLEACSGKGFGNRCSVLPKHFTKRCYH